MAQAAQNQQAIFAMGCFWCGATAFEDHKTQEKIPGVLSVRVGYTGGDQENPTYEDHDGHREAVQVTYDPDQISYETLLDIFWHNVDPLDDGGQFCDRGLPYTSAIYYTTPDQEKAASLSAGTIDDQLGARPHTEILPAKRFWDAEEYHQEYHLKNPIRYQYYRWNCGRDKRLKELWGGDAKK